MLKKLLGSRATISVLLLIVAVGLFLNLFTLWTRDPGIPVGFAQSGSGGGSVAVTTVEGKLAIAWIEGGKCYYTIHGQVGMGRC